MKTASVILLLLLISTVSGFVQTPIPSPRPMPEKALSNEDALREAVFLKILEPWKSTSRKDLRFFYIAVDKIEDPSKGLLTRLQVKFANLRNDSDCYIADDSSVVDDQTGERGVRFTISKIDWKGEDKAKVEGGSYIGNMGADSCTYTLERKEGRWEVSLVEKCWIS